MFLKNMTNSMGDTLASGISIGEDSIGGIKEEGVYGLELELEEGSVISGKDLNQDLGSTISCGEMITEGDKLSSTVF
jgi:hypothetical protein